jgi:hypothetical protein
MSAVYRALMDIADERKIISDADLVAVVNAVNDAGNARASSSWLRTNGIDMIDRPCYQCEALRAKHPAALRRYVKHAVDVDIDPLVPAVKRTQ